MPENAFAIIKFSDLKEFREVSEEHPLIQAIWTEQMQEYMAPMLGQLDADVGDSFEDEMGVDFETFLDYFDGQVLLAILPKIDEETKSITLNVEPDFIVLMEFGCEFEKIRDMMYSSAEYDSDTEGFKHTIEEEEFLGGTLFIEDIDYGDETELAGAYMRYENIIATSPTVEPLRTALEFLSGDRDDRNFEDIMLEAPEYAGLEEGDVIIAGNLKVLFKSIEDNVIADAAEQQAAVMPFDMATLMQTLNLDSIEFGSMMLSLTEEEVLLRTAISYADEPGIMDLFKYEKDALPDASFAPPNSFSVATTTFDVSAFFTVLENMVQQATPMFHTMYQAQLANIRATQNIDLRAAFFENLTPGLVTFSAFPEDVAKDDEHYSLESTCYVLNIKDRQAMESAIEALKSLAAQGYELFETRDYLGSKIYETPQRDNPAVPGQLAPAFAYTFTDTQWIISIGSSKLLENVLARKESDANPLWEQEGIADAIETMPGDPVARSYVNLSTIMDVIFQAMEQASMATGEQMLDSSARPEFEKLAFTLVSQNYDEPGCFYNIVRILQQ